MATYGPAMSDFQRSEIIRRQSDFLRSFQGEPETCVTVAIQGGGGLSQAQLSSKIVTFNQLTLTIMEVLIEARTTAKESTIMPRAPSDEDYATLAESLVNNGMSQIELQALGSVDSTNPALYCGALIKYLDAVAEFQGSGGESIRFEATQSLLTAQ